MRSVIQLVRSLGNAGAVANARAAVTARRDEAAMVRALALRLPSPSRTQPAVAHRGDRAA